ERRGDRPGVLSREIKAKDDDREKNQAGGDLRHKIPLVELRIVTGLCGRDPFQQMPSINEYAEQRAADRVNHQPGLMGEERDQECALQKSQFKIAALSAPVIAQGGVGAARRDSGK